MAIWKKQEDGKIVETVSVVPEEAKSTKPKFDGKAYSIYKHPINGRWILVEVTYDTRSLEAGKVNILDESTDREEAMERFKLATVKSGIIG